MIFFMSTDLHYTVWMMALTGMFIMDHPLSPYFFLVAPFIMNNSLCILSGTPECRGFLKEEIRRLSLMFSSRLWEIWCQRNMLSNGVTTILMSTLRSSGGNHFPLFKHNSWDFSVWFLLDNRGNKFHYQWPNSSCLLLVFHDNKMDML